MNNDILFTTAFVYKKKGSDNLVLSHKEASEWHNNLIADGYVHCATIDTFAFLSFVLSADFKTIKTTIKELK